MDKFNRVFWIISALITLTIPAQSEYVWMGGVNSIWDLTTANWTVDGNDGQTWKTGADTVFNDTSSRRTITISSAVTPNSVIFNNDNDYTMAGPIAGTGTFTKRGKGKLTITDASSTFTGDVLIEGGEIKMTAGNDGANTTKSGLGNPRADRTITVTNGASLTFSAINTFGGGGKSTQKVRANFRIVDGASLNLATNDCSSIGDLYLENGKLTYHGGKLGACEWGTLTCNNMTFRGNNPYSFPAIGTDYNDSSGKAHCGVILGRNEECIIDVADITGDDKTDVDFGWKVLYCQNGNTPGSFTKRGKGTLQLSNPANQYRGPVRVEEGTVVFSGTDCWANDDSCMGARKVVHTNWVGAGATITLNAPDLQGGSFDNDSKIVTHIDGGRMIVSPYCNNALGPVILENASLIYWGHKIGTYYSTVDGVTTWTNIDWPTLSFYGGLFCKGSNTYTFASTYAGDNCPIFFFRNSEFYVDDITKDEKTDVLCNVRINDMPNWYSSNDNGPLGITKKTIPASFIKTGKGTLEFGGETLYSMFTGDVVIREGCLKISATDNNISRFTANHSPLGNMRVPHTVTVCNGAELNFAISDIFGQHSTPIDGLCIAVSNATLSQVKGFCNGFGELSLFNANVIYSDGAGGSRNWGIFVLGKKVIFDGDNGKPYEWKAPENIGYMSLGYLNEHEILNNGLIHKGWTEICVKDITNNGNVDATIGVILQDQPNWGSRTINNTMVEYCCGLHKTGTGTLRLTNNNIYTGATEVVEGTLLIDSPSSKSEITVKSGAYLGGIGNIDVVKFENGSGLTAAPDQKSALTISRMTLPQDNVLKVNITYPNDITKIACFTVPIIKQTGFENITWQALYNGGDAPKNYRANTFVKDGIVYGRVAKSGMCVMIR